MSTIITMLETVNDLEKGKTYRLRAREAQDLIAHGQAAENPDQPVAQEEPVKEPEPEPAPQTEPVVNKINPFKKGKK